MKPPAPGESLTPSPAPRSAWFYRYVPHARVAAYVALGWRDLGPCVGPGGFYSALMRWDGDNPQEPA